MNDEEKNYYITKIKVCISTAGAVDSLFLWTTLTSYSLVACKYSMSERIYQVIIGVLVLVVIVGGWMMIASKRSSSSTQMDMVSTSTASGSDTSDVDMETSVTKNSTSMHSQAAAGEDVQASDQKAGMSVMVDSVTLKGRGWVAVEDSKNWVMGAERLEAGTHTNVAVTLLRGTVAGQTYKVVLFADDGDKMFDLHKDTIIKNSDGSMLSAAFIAK